MNASGRIKVGLGPVVGYFRSLPLNALDEVVVGPDPIVIFCQGIPRNAAGHVVGLRADNASFFGPGAIPYGPNGELISNPSDPTGYFQGVGYFNASYAGSGAAGAPVTVTKDFTLTPAQVSASSAGFRANPPAGGTLAPDAAYAGGTIVAVTANNDDHIVVQTASGLQFPGISGNLTMQLGVYQGPTRIILPWATTLYEAVVPGIYVYMQSLIGAPSAMRFSAAPP